MGMPMYAVTKSSTAQLSVVKTWKPFRKMTMKKNIIDAHAM